MSKVEMIRCDHCTFEQEAWTAVDWVTVGPTTNRVQATTLRKEVHLCSLDCVKEWADERQEALLERLEEG